MNTKIDVYCRKTPCASVDQYRPFGETHCTYLCIYDIIWYICQLQLDKH